MVDVTQADINALTVELRNFTNVIKGSSGMGVGEDFSKKMNDMGRVVEKTAKEYAADVVSKKRHNEELKKSIEGLIDGMDTKELEMASKIYKNTLINSSNAWARQLGQSINNVEDFVAVQRMSSEQFVKDLKLARELEQKGGAERDRATELMAKYNIELEELRRTDEELLATHEELVKASHKTRRGMEFNLGKMKQFGVALLTLTQAVLRVGESAARTGTQMEYLDAALMGMSPDELNQLQGDYKQVIQASSMTMDDFNTIIGKTGTEMITYTGSLRDAARLEAQSIHQAKILGEQQAAYAEQERERFKRLHNSMSMTTEQFMDLNEQLLHNTDVQSHLFRLNMQQRGAFMADLKNTYEKLRLDGLMHEQAQKVVDAFAAIGAKSPKERLKEAAKLQAVMGVVGMGGGQAARAAEMVRARQTGTAEFAELMKQTQLRVGERMQGGFQSEMMMSTVLQSTGLDHLLGPHGSLASLGTQQNLAMDQHTAQNAMQINLLEQQLGAGADFYRMVNTGFQIVNSFLGGSITNALGTLATFFIGAAFSNQLASIMAAVTAKMAGMSSMMGGAFGKAGKFLKANPVALGMGAVAGGASYMAGGDTTQALSAAGGASTGAWIGGIVGSVIAPGIGTAIGVAAGTALGGYLGHSATGKKTLAEQSSELHQSIAAKAQEMEEARAKEHTEKNVKVYTQLNEELKALREQLADAEKTRAEHDKKWARTDEELNKEQIAQKEKHHDENKRNVEKGYRVMWARAPNAISGAPSA